MNKYVVKIDCGTDTFVDDEYSELLTAEQEINNQTRDLQISIKKDSPQISFLNSSIGVAGCLMIRPVDDSSKLKHIDMVTGYAQFQHLPEQYKFGIPYMTEFRKVTSVDFAI